MKGQLHSESLANEKITFKMTETLQIKRFYTILLYEIPCTII